MRRAFALLYGLACHGVFAAAVAAMIVGLYTGMASARGSLDGAAAWLVNGLLALQFPVAHSYLLSRRGRRRLSSLVPFGLGRELSTTTYAWIASLQLLLVFGLWSPSGVVLWAATGGLEIVMTLSYAVSWLLVARAMYDAGLALQTGALGWIAVVRRRQPRYPPMPTRGLFALTRQPIYLGFALALWTGPVLTLDRALLALLWTAYCVLGPVFKERRFNAHYGGSFAAYRSRVPYFLPFPR